MKKALFLSLFFVSSAIAGFAQSKTVKPSAAQTVNDVTAADATVQKNAADATAKLDQIVTLTDEQKQKINGMNMSIEQRKMMTSKAEEPSRSKIAEELEKNRLHMYTQILTPEQMKKYNDYLAKNK